MNAKYSERPYTQKEYLNDLYQGVWNKTEQGKALDYYDRNLQYAYVQYLLKELELTKDAEKSKGLSLELLTEDHLPCYGYEYHRHARQMSANTKISDLGISSKTLYYGQLVKLKEGFRDGPFVLFSGRKVCPGIPKPIFFQIIQNNYRIIVFVQLFIKSFEWVLNNLSLILKVFTPCFD